MLDTTPQTTTLQRSHGRARVALRAGGALDRMEQAGSAKVILPRVHGPVPEAVFLNTSGGLTSGDRLEFQMDLAAGVRATATTQTAERAYRANGPAAQVRVVAHVGAGGRLDWLPQETILFEASALHRSTEINLAADAACLICETVILGRHAMGETPQACALTDRRVINRANRPVLVETLRLDQTVLAAAHRPGILGGARAFAFVALVAEGAADALAPLRDVLTEPGVIAAATAFDGKCILRLTACDGWPLRRQIIRALAMLRPGHSLPRVWQA
ncbi:MAG: urease accessory protein UreD [Gemmobacter sp.]|nr:urease accessory protein UreD [Gemmobacter sp.]